MNEDINGAIKQLLELTKASSPILIAIFMTIWGRILKASPLPNRLIPLVMCFSGALLYMGLEGFTYRNGILGATIAGLAAVGVHQVWTQFMNAAQVPEHEDPALVKPDPNKQDEKKP